MNKFIAGLSLLFAVILSACNATANKTEATVSGDAANSVFKTRIHPTYAEGFHITYAEEFALVDIQDPLAEESETFHFAFVPRGTKPKGIPADYTPIEVPIQSAVCMTVLQLSNFIKLDAQDKVVGMSSSRHLFNDVMKARLKEGSTVKIGIEGNFDTELIMSMNPDLILVSPFKRGGYEAMKEVGAPLVPHLGYKEMTPLGQAEWVKFVAFLIGEEEKGNEVFAGIEKRYNDLIALTHSDKVTHRPVVFSGDIRGGNWYSVGGKSFLAQIFKDAGADYFLKDDERSGGVTLDFETAYTLANQCEYWRIANSYKGTYTYDVLKDQDARHADFRAFKEKGVVYCNMTTTPYYERMPVEPEVLLADFISVFHPDLLPDHTPVYYTLLK